MKFPNPDFDHEALKKKVKIVIESHGHNLNMMNPQARELRTAEGSIEIKPHEIPWVQHMIIERVQSIEREIEILQTSVDDYSASNMNNAREKLSELIKERSFLKDNFAHKFFKNPSV